MTLRGPGGGGGVGYSPQHLSVECIHHQLATVFDDTGKSEVFAGPGAIKNKAVSRLGGNEAFAFQHQVGLLLHDNLGHF